MKVSLIVTVLNEEKYIGKLIDSIFIQTKVPDEIIIVDGGSSDGTVAAIQNLKFRIQNKNVGFKIIKKPGNRAVGRNEAIKNASGDIILCTDAGCILNKNWVKNIIESFSDPKVDVVAGYYNAKTSSIFEKCLIPYVLVMPDRVDPQNFLPSTRSMAFKKPVWKKAGGFDEEFSHNEDYVFANKLKKGGAKIVFAKKAIVYWLPRNNLLQSFKMFFRFALGDIEAKLYRDRVLYLFLRYIFAFYLIILSLIIRSFAFYIFIIACFLGYIVWAVWKNYKYVNNLKAIFFLPLLQFTSDLAVISGSSLGLIKKLSIKSISDLFFKNKLAALVILIYALTELWTISYGVPNPSHPFDYFMDEWHQSQAVRDLFKYGTPNIAGAANGSIFQFFLTGIYLIPFYVLRIIDPFAIKSSVTNLSMQKTLFEVLRLNTLLFGVSSIILISYIAKKYFKLNAFLTVFLFAINPIWLMLSNYFKYDIALIFWILLSFLFILNYADKPKNSRLYSASFFSALSMSVKVSAIPLIPIIFFVFLFYTPNVLKKIRTIILSGVIFLVTFALFGIPDIVFGKGNIYGYLYSNLISSPNYLFKTINFQNSYLSLMFFHILPVAFGHVFFYLFFVFLLASLIVFSKNCRKQKFLAINLISLLLFSLSLLVLREGAAGNRLLVLLPFMAITASFMFSYIYKKAKNRTLRFFMTLIFILLLSIQTLEAFSWVVVKTSPDPRQLSSLWIKKNIPKNDILGIENIPIYQSLPDVILKEFYDYRYKRNYQNNRYRYAVVNSKSKLPKYIILSNDSIKYHYFKKSGEKDLIIELKKENYKKLAVFRPNLSLLSHFDSEFDYYYSGLVLSPNTISIYEKK